MHTVSRRIKAVINDTKFRDFDGDTTSIRYLPPSRRHGTNTGDHNEMTCRLFTDCTTSFSYLHNGYEIINGVMLSKATSLDPGNGLLRTFLHATT